MTKIEKTVNLMKEENTYRRYEDGDSKYSDFSKQIFNEDKRVAANRKGYRKST